MKARCMSTRGHDGRRCGHAPHPGLQVCWAHRERGAGLTRKVVLYVPVALWERIEALVALGLFGDGPDQALLELAKHRLLELFPPILTPRTRRRRSRG